PYHAVSVHRMLRAGAEGEAGTAAVVMGEGESRASRTAKSGALAERRAVQAHATGSTGMRLKSRRSLDAASPENPSLSGGAWIIPQELHAFGLETSESERRSADAERELMEWKKVSFMAERLGDEFD